MSEIKGSKCGNLVFFTSYDLGIAFIQFPFAELDFIDVYITFLEGLQVYSFILYFHSTSIKKGYPGHF